MKASKNSNVAKSEFVKLRENLVIEGKFKSIFMNKFNRPVLVLKDLKKDREYLISLTEVLRNKLKKAKSLIDENSVIRIECLGKTKKGYWNFNLFVNDVEIGSNRGLELL